MRSLAFFSVNYMNENIGKDFPKLKGKRGRPKLLTPNEETGWRMFVRDGEPGTLRTVQNWYYYGTAAKLLLDTELGKPLTPENAKRFGWLLRPDGKTIYPRKSIMFQLGRIRCPIALEVFAEELNRLKPTATEAIKMIRRWKERRDTLAALHICENPSIKINDKLLERFAREAVAKFRSIKL